MTYLGLDLGTSSAKAALMDAEGAVIASRSAPLAVSRPAPGWSEQAPQDWIEACWAALDIAQFAETMREAAQRQRRALDRKRAFRLLRRGAK